MRIQRLLLPHVAVFGLLLAGCSREPQDGASGVKADAKQEAPAVAARPPSAKEPAFEQPRARERDWAKRLRIAHQSADEATDPKSKLEAAASLLQLANAELFSSEQTETLRQDACARAAELQLQAGDYETARKTTAEALSRFGLNSTARAQLFIALADAEAALGNKDAANDALIQALQVNQKLFEEEIRNP